MGVLWYEDDTSSLTNNWELPNLLLDLRQTEKSRYEKKLFTVKYFYYNYKLSNTIWIIWVDGSFYYITWIMVLFIYVKFQIELYEIFLII